MLGYGRGAVIVGSRPASAGGAGKVQVVKSPERANPAAGRVTMIRKHSATLHGHRTSISLEEPFWAELHAMAAARGIALAQLIAEIDDSRPEESNLSSAIRVQVLLWLKARRH